MKILTKKQQKKLYKTLDKICSNNRTLFLLSNDSSADEAETAFLANIDSICDVCGMVLGNKYSGAFYVEQLQKSKKISENIEEEIIDKQQQSNEHEKR